MVYVRKLTLVLWVLLSVFLIVLSFFIGQLTVTVGSKNDVPQSHEQVVSNVVVNENRHTAKAAYEAGWNACMRCWGITSTEGLDFENAYCSPSSIKPPENTIFLDINTPEPYVLISELLGSQELDSYAAKSIFSQGFGACMQKWSISYAYSSRSYSDDITYGFNNWY